jgi:hypothetical protein
MPRVTSPPRHPCARLAAALLAIAASHSAAGLAGTKDYAVTFTSPSCPASLSAAITATSTLPAGAIALTDGKLFRRNHTPDSPLN